MKRDRATWTGQVATSWLSVRRQFLAYRSLWILLLVAIGLTLCMALALVRGTSTLSSGAAWVAHTERIRYQVAQLLASMSQLGSGLSVFDGTQDSRWFEPALAADATIAGQIAALEQSVAAPSNAQSNERELVERLVDLARQRQAQTRAARDRELRGERLPLELLSNESRRLMGPALALSNQLQALESMALARHDEDLRSARSRLQVGIASTAGIAIFLLGSMTLLTISHTERRRKLEADGAAARALSETRFQTVVDASPVGLTMLRPVRDAAGDIVDFDWTFMNRAGAAMLGRPANLLVGRHVSEVFANIWQDTNTLDKLVECFQSGGPQSFETDHCLTSETGGFYQVGCRLGDELLLWFADFTERAIAANQIAERERRFVALANAVPQQVWVGRPDGTVAYVNRRWCEYTGLALEDAQAGAAWEYVHVDDRERSRRAWTQSLQTGAPFEVEHRLLAPDGTCRWFLSRANAEIDERGNVIAWYGTSTDIDEGKRVAKALRDADRRKDDFLATLAHELRNPLAPIRNAAQILGSPTLSPSQLQWAHGVIRRQVTHMAWLLDDLLDVARINRGKLELKKGRVVLASIVEAAIESARPLIESKDHQLHIALPQAPVTLHADAVRLSQILGNLLTNAAKYTEPRGRIDLEAQMDAGMLRIAVRDNGIGIAAHHLEQIFDMFIQLEQTASRAEGGLGIGLSLVKALTELHGGKATARSDGPGRGSEFTIWLPTPEFAAPATAAAAYPMPPAQPRPGRRVLVADDNQDAAESLAMILTLVGHEVRVAHDGAHALAMAQEFRPDVALLDIGMPRMNGYELAAHLRREPWARDLRMIALTGWGQERDRECAKQAGFDHHLTKPIDTDVLYRTLDMTEDRGADPSRGAEPSRQRA